MPINLICACKKYKNKLGIAYKNVLPWNNITEDLLYFKNVTSASKSKSIVIMGNNTWMSIPKKYKPLKNRYNIILTNSPKYYNNKYYSEYNNVLFTKLSSLEKLLTKSYIENNDIFIIGGGQIYELFLNHKTLYPTKLYITEISESKLDKSNPEYNIIIPDTFLSKISDNYKLISYSKEKIVNIDITNIQIKYRFLKYTYSKSSNNSEKEYNRLYTKIIESGNYKNDRTNTGTISIFGDQCRFDISNTVPLLTTKQVPWKTCIEELLWFIRGDTDSKILEKKGVNIWKGNTSRDFLDKRNLQEYKEGILGPGYGWQWRFKGADYDQKYSDTSKFNPKEINGFDQLEYVINELKTNENSRRIMMDFWDPVNFDKIALVPCHYSIQFYVNIKNKIKYLSAHFTMRSSDLFLGFPFNIFSYTVLVYIIAKKCNMKPGELIYSGGDIHIYKNHLDKIKLQLNRIPSPEPALELSDSIYTKDLREITIEDFKLIGYFPENSIKADMAI